MTAASEQLIRSTRIRAPDVDDGLVVPQVGNSVSLEDFQSYVVSQLRQILGTQKWTDFPTLTIADVASNFNALSLNTATFACTNQDGIGSVVMPDGNGGVITADSSFNRGFGVIIQKPDQTTALVQFGGVVTGVFQGLQPRAQYFLGQRGAIITPPLQNPGLLYVQPIGVALSASVLALNVGPAIKRDLT